MSIALCLRRTIPRGHPGVRNSARSSDRPVARRRVHAVLGSRCTSCPGIRWRTCSGGRPGTSLSGSSNALGGRPDLQSSTPTSLAVSGRQPGQHRARRDQRDGRSRDGRDLRGRRRRCRAPSARSGGGAGRAIRSRRRGCCCREAQDAARGPPAPGVRGGRTHGAPQSMAQRQLCGRPGVDNVPEQSPDDGRPCYGDDARRPLVKVAGASCRTARAQRSVPG
jgi:hypothetical protein